jgi:Fe-S cluster biogenesis protein NfuA
MRISQELRQRVEAALDRLRPALIADGGNVELIDVDPDGTVRVALQGACATCPAIHATVRFAIEPALCEDVPQVKAVIPV